MRTSIVQYLGAALLMGATLLASPAQSESLTLACGRSEADALAKAPPGVRRISTDRLRIQWAKGTRFFVNSGLQPGGLEGLGYEYCGFLGGYHLIAKSDDGLWTGVMLDAASGRVLPAGHTVKFSPDGARYFAVQQPDGLDGEEWMLYARDGVRLWMGLSGITARSEEGRWEYFVATFEEPHWSVAGEVEATLRCAADTTRTAAVTLRASEGHYAWVQTISCPTD